MKIILDVNVILSAILKDSITRRIIFKSKHHFYFPEYAFEKIEKHQDYIIEKSRLEKEEFSTLLKRLFKHIEIIPTINLEEHWLKSTRIMEEIDPEDVVFIAAALSIQCAVIWSEDKHFNKQKVIKFLKTKDMMRLMEELKE